LYLSFRKLVSPENHLISPPQNPDRTNRIRKVKPNPKWLVMFFFNILRAFLSC
jgi:quinol-cytochrome oxidoreductase complex cytochrome b subunit